MYSMSCVLMYILYVGLSCLCLLMSILYIFTYMYACLVYLCTYILYVASVAKRLFELCVSNLHIVPYYETKGNVNIFLRIV